MIIHSSSRGNMIKFKECSGIIFSPEYISAFGILCRFVKSFYDLSFINALNINDITNIYFSINNLDPNKS
jgi:hypothetical protein